ncbi:MAG: hypothetical protein MR600_03665, partial [Subdoligranulum sp.]|nr:hypothetical protein [Subdoligranulum sp.]
LRNTDAPGCTEMQGRGIFSARAARPFRLKATPHNSKCRCSEREVQAAKQKAQIILCVLSSIFATQIVLRSRSSGA